MPYWNWPASGPPRHFVAQIPVIGESDRPRRCRRAPSPLQSPATGVQSPGEPYWNWPASGSAGSDFVAQVPRHPSPGPPRRCRVWPVPVQSPTTGIQPGMPYWNWPASGAAGARSRCRRYQVSVVAGSTTPMPVVAGAGPVAGHRLPVGHTVLEFTGVRMPGAQFITQVPGVRAWIDDTNADMTRAGPIANNRYPARLTVLKGTRGGSAASLSALRFQVAVAGSNTPAPTAPAVTVVVLIDGTVRSSSVSRARATDWRTGRRWLR